MSCAASTVNTVIINATTDTPRPKIVAFTGAGISAAAGLATYRGAGGTWTQNPDLERLSSAHGLTVDADSIWAHIDTLRAAAAAATPTLAHHAIAAAQEWADVTVITQNIDGLHQRAGSSNVIELHGSAFRLRCSKRRCVGPTVDHPGGNADELRCSWCDRPMRPDVVLFDEQLDATTWRAALRAANQADHIIAVGTSGHVWPAREIIDPLPHGAELTIITTEPWESPHPAVEDGRATHLIANAEIVVPNVLATIHADTWPADHT